MVVDESDNGGHSRYFPVENLKQKVSFSLDYTFPCLIHL